MDLAFRISLILHISAGTIAVISGLMALVTPKPMFAPGARAHRKTGRVFDWAMRGVIGTAIVMTVLHFNPYLAALTSAAGILAISGVRVLRRKNGKDRATLLDWIVACAVLAVGLYLLMMLSGGMILRNVGIIRTLTILSLVYASWDLWRFAFPSAFPFTRNLWLYEHLVKLIGALFAAIAAFSGSVLVLFPPPWRQLWATFAGNLITIVLLIRYVRAMRLRNERTPTTT